MHIWVAIYKFTLYISVYYMKCSLLMLQRLQRGCIIVALPRHTAYSHSEIYRDSGVPDVHIVSFIYKFQINEHVEKKSGLVNENFMFA